ncbi:MAG: hypothetical protein R2797_06430 [Gelidibacter sp.]
MNKRDYYSVRTGKIKPNQEIDLKVLKRLFLVIYRKLEEDGYFQKYFGYYCVDQGEVSGELGSDLDSIFFIHLKKENLFPIHGKIDSYEEDDLFDVIEFLHDHCSKGIDGQYHSWNDCGYHYSEFSDKEGKQHYKNQLNPLLKDYGGGFEISEDGEILQLADSGLSNLFEADVPSDDKENITDKIDKAVTKFRRYKSTIDDRQEAIRELVDVLEFLRPQAKKLLDKNDESDLFNIANNFGIRHHNEQQKSKYDKAIWHSWMFYHYLSTIHALLRLIKKEKN